MPTPSKARPGRAASRVTKKKVDSGGDVEDDDSVGETKFERAVLRSLGALTERVTALESDDGRSRSDTASCAHGSDKGPAPAGGLADRLLAGLDRFERAQQRARKDHGGNDEPEARSECDDGVKPDRGGERGRDTRMKDEYARMSRLLINPAHRVLELGTDIESYRDWPFTGPASERVAPTMAPQVFAGGQSALQWGEALLQRHKVKDGVLADVIRRYCLCIDMSITYDSIKQPGYNPLNAAALEVVFRDLYGIEQALMGKKTKKGQHGKSADEYLPDWARRELYDVVALTNVGSQVPHADDAAVKYALRQQCLDKVASGRIARGADE